MRKFIQNKLWRDNTVIELERQGSKIHWHALSDDDFKLELGRKLAEEADEVTKAKSRDELVDELADLLEVFDAIIAANGLTEHEILERKKDKFLKRGGFSARKFVTMAEHPRGSAGECYCLENPQKYPEDPTKA